MNTAIDDTTGGWRWFRRKRDHRISVAERAHIAAQGKALAMLVTTMHTNGHLDAKRFADMLALFGTVVSEDDRLQGAILASWADALEESLALAGT